MSQRKVVAERDGVVLAELIDGDRELLEAGNDHAFESDPDDRPRLQTVESYQLGVIDSTTGELIGGVSWHAEGYGPTVNCAAWNIGIALLPAARGRGAGTIAQRLLAEHLLATTPVDRIEASTEVINVAERKALSRAGFRVEGVVRGAAMRAGQRRDYVSYGLLRSDLRDDEQRRIVIERDGVALGTPLRGEREWAFAAAGSEFDLDEDDRPLPFALSASGWLIVIDVPAAAPIGGVSWHPVSYGGTMGCAAWNIGVGLVPEARGRGAGTIAQRLLAEHLFATTPLDRVEAGTDVDNLAEQRSLEKAGFRREGVVRGAQVRGGRRRDIVNFGLIRADLTSPPPRNSMRRLRPS